MTKPLPDGFVDQLKLLTQTDIQGTYSIETNRSRTLHQFIEAYGQPVFAEFVQALLNQLADSIPHTQKQDANQVQHTIAELTTIILNDYAKQLKPAEFAVFCYAFKGGSIATTYSGSFSFEKRAYTFDAQTVILALRAFVQWKNGALKRYRNKVENNYSVRYYTAGNFCAWKIARWIDAYRNEGFYEYAKKFEEILEQGRNFQPDDVSCSQQQHCGLASCPVNTKQ